MWAGGGGVGGGGVWCGCGVGFGSESGGLTGFGWNIYGWHRLHNKVIDVWVVYGSYLIGKYWYCLVEFVVGWDETIILNHGCLCTKKISHN